jgi:hypothetical protein
MQIVPSSKTILSLALSAFCLASAHPAAAQSSFYQRPRADNAATSSFYQRFRAHNAGMAAYQPSWMAPLCQADTRIGQGIKFSVANLQTNGTRQIVYGNGHGFSTILANRFQLDFNPPSYFRNHSATAPDGFSNASAQVKVRIASGNAQHGNYAFTAVLFHAFAPRGYQNGYLSSVYFPKLGYGRAFGRFNIQSMFDGQLPTARIYAQGRAVDWNTAAQLHPTAHIWLNLENNATFFYAGPNDGKRENFLTPVAFYQIRRSSWSPTHALVTFDAGMQIATTRYHQFNHNLITEMRIGF